MRTGLLGDIIPEPLVHGLTADDLLTWWSDLTDEEPNRRNLSLAISAFHQRRMRTMFTKARSDIERGLVKAILAGQLVNIAPIGAQSTDITAQLTFAPVLQRIGEGRWRLGTPDYGRYLEWDEALPGAAMRRAQALYGQWFDEELRAVD